MEPEEVRGVGLMWHVASEGQPRKQECKQRETTEKKHLHGWGTDNGAQRLGQHSRVPGKDVSKEKKTKKIKKKLTQRGGNMRSGPWKKSRSQCKGMLKLQHMPKSPDPSSTFPCVQMLS